MRSFCIWPMGLLHKKCFCRNSLWSRSIEIPIQNIVPREINIFLNLEEIIFIMAFICIFNVLIMNCV